MQQCEEAQYSQDLEEMPHKEEKQCEGPGLMNRIEKDKNSEDGDQHRRNRQAAATEPCRSGGRSEEAVERWVRRRRATGF